MTGDCIIRVKGGWLTEDLLDCLLSGRNKILVEMLIEATRARHAPEGVDPERMVKSARRYLNDVYGFEVIDEVVDAENTSQGDLPVVKEVAVIRLHNDNSSSSISALELRRESTYPKTPEFKTPAPVVPAYLAQRKNVNNKRRNG